MALMGLKRRWVLLIVILAAFGLFAHLLSVSDVDIRQTINRVPLPGMSKNHETLETAGFMNEYVAQDKHPISQLIAEADKRWAEYEESRSKTFRECVATYRRKYGRHPPPGFDTWYKFARERRVHNIDDFEQIMGDLRPFWAIQPRIMRSLAAHLWETDAVSGIHIRNHKVVKMNNGGWRTDAFVDSLKSFLKYLPDIDISMNRYDQPRVVVPWDDMQALLAKETETRTLPPEVLNEFSTNLTNMYDVVLGAEDGKPREDPGWYSWAGKQYMEVAKMACPPESHANLNEDVAAAEATWKDRLGGIVKNFNLSSDLCTVGPEIQNMHGFLYAASSVVPTKRLIPIFGECKVNINSDILFPANMYWMFDERYTYKDTHDENWDQKEATIVWRGATSGGTQRADNWQTMHRPRLAMLFNETLMDGEEVRILTEQPEAQGEYENFRQFKPAKLVGEHSDVGFTDIWGCDPLNCSFYDNVWTKKQPIPLGSHFLYKYLVDVDGHSFSGRWRAFLQSKSLGIKATIFREWHDSRLFAWRHFVPMDNRYDDIFSILTYFMGTGDPEHRTPGEAVVRQHDLEAKRIALQGREWAQRVLRPEDIEIYTFRLLLEYARLLDDNRDRIGYSGDGSELDKFDESWVPL